MSRQREPKFYQTKEFKKLYEKWVTGKNSKLKKAGFSDSERANGALKMKNCRTQAFQQQETISHICSALTAYIENPSVQIRPMDRKILTLYSQGVYQKKIIEITGRSHQTVWKTQKKHIPIALGLYAHDEG